jgi:hypothetical protein
MVSVSPIDRRVNAQLAYQVPHFPAAQLNVIGNSAGRDNVLTYPAQQRSTGSTASLYGAKWPQ